MFIESSLLSAWLIVLSGLAAGPVLAWAAWAAPWQALAQDQRRVHALGGSLVLLVLLHSLAFGVGLNVASVTESACAFIIAPSPLVQLFGGI